MKTTIVTLAAAAMLMTSTNVFATGNVVTLSDSDWTAIEQETELENMLAIEEIPAIKLTEVKVNWDVIEQEAELESMLADLEAVAPVTNQALSLNLEHGRQAAMTLQAPYADADQVGVVVLDENGNIVYSNTGSFGELKSLRFNPVYKANATYVVRVYSVEQLFETKLQVVNF